MVTRSAFVRIFLIALFLALLAGCVPVETAPSSTQAPTLPPSLVPSQSPSAEPILTPVSYPEITLTKGGFYFSLDGMQSFLFSRNIAGYEPQHYLRLLDLTRNGGSRMVRIQLDSMGTGITPNGDLDEVWAQKWERVLDKAAANNIYVILTFTAWYDWNNGTPDFGYSNWKANSFSAANGGPAATPAELFKPGSATQSLWLAWMAALVERWKDRGNIAAWEIFSEVNLATGAAQATGIAFVEKAADLIRDADSHQRPITASLADTGGWENFNLSDAIDFINIHPYPPSGQLDRKILADVREIINKYKKPVMIGESGLSALTPDSQPATLTTSDRADIGISHAIWAGMVSGAMNGRSLWWEDGVGIYFPRLSWPYLNKYADADLAASRFIGQTDFKNFKPLKVVLTSTIFGAAVGNEESVIGWFRDASCEPPNWDVQPKISNQNVTITIPGSHPNWQVDFYDTKTGTEMIKSTIVARNGDAVLISLPNFTDDIAFKMVPTIDTPTGFEPTRKAELPIDLIAGEWTGTITSDTSGFSTPIILSIKTGCTMGNVCGTVSVPKIPCSGNLFFKEMQGDVLIFIEQNMQGSSDCVSGGTESLQLEPEGSLSLKYKVVLDQGVNLSSSAILKRP